MTIKYNKEKIKKIKNNKKIIKIKEIKNRKKIRNHNFFLYIK